MGFTWDFWVEINIFAAENRPSRKETSLPTIQLFQVSFRECTPLVTPLVHISVPNAIVENKAEHVALPNEKNEHMYYCVSGTNYLFLHIIILYIYIHTFILCLCTMYQHLPSPFLNSRA